MYVKIRKYGKKDLIYYLVSAVGFRILPAILLFDRLCKYLYFFFIKRFLSNDRQFLANSGVLGTKAMHDDWKTLTPRDEGTFALH